jgi:hypothetical protein
VPSLSHPGSNLTGLAFQNPELTGKRLELLHDVVSSARQIAVLRIDRTSVPDVEC